MMADCERALGRPEKALALTREKQVRELSEGTQIEMLIVAAGARRDMGQTAAAIQTLEVPELTKRTRAEWLPRLRYAYADALEAAGRTEDALVWFHRAAGVDAGRCHRGCRTCCRSSKASSSPTSTKTTQSWTTSTSSRKTRRADERCGRADDRGRAEDA